MKQEVVDLVGYRLEKARNTLLDAKKYIKETTPESAVNPVRKLTLIQGIKFRVREKK